MGYQVFTAGLEPPVDVGQRKLMDSVWHIGRHQAFCAGFVPPRLGTDQLQPAGRPLAAPRARCGSSLGPCADVGCAAPRARCGSSLGPCVDANYPSRPVSIYATLCRAMCMHSAVRCLLVTMMISSMEKTMRTNKISTQRNSDKSWGEEFKLTLKQAGLTFKLQGGLLFITKLK